MIVKLIAVLVVFALVACKSEENTGEVRNGIRIKIYEGFYGCVKTDSYSFVYIEIPFTMTPQDGGKAGIATYIKALDGSFVSYLDKHKRGWRKTFGPLPHDSFLEEWANNPKVVAEHIRKTEKIYEDVKKLAKKLNITMEEAIERVSAVFSGVRPKYSEVHCRATTSILINEDKFEVVCKSSDDPEGIKFIIPKTPLTPIYKEYSDVVRLTFVCN